MAFAGGDHVIVRIGLLEHQPHRFHVLAGVAPIALRLQVAQPDFLALPGQNPRHPGRDLAGDELKAAARRFVVKKDAVRGVHPVGFTVIAGQVKPCYLADAVRRTGVEPRVLVLGHGFSHAEHLARTGEVEAAVGGQGLEGGQQEVGAVDVGVQRGKLVVEGIADETLGRQVVALVRLDLVNHPVDAGIAF